MRDFAPGPLLINQAVWLSNARTLRKSGSPAPGTTAACQVAPPSSVRRYAPSAPLAQTTAGLTALTPRKDAVVPLDCAIQVCASAPEAAATSIRHSASVGQCNSLIPLNRILQIGHFVGRAPSPAAGPLAGLPAGGRGRPQRSRGTAQGTAPRHLL